ncbi:MAG: polysaccharide deacetylase family protein [Spirochaetaceae bacterium]
MVSRSAVQRIPAVLFLLVMAALPLAAEAEFSGLDLAPDNRLLFQASVTVPDRGRYETLFQADLEAERLEQLTFFPEQIVLLRESEQLQIQNRFGVFRSTDGLRKLAPLEEFGSFTEGQQIATGKIHPLRASPDGRFLVYTEPYNDVRGDIILHDLSTDETRTVVNGAALSTERRQVSWAPDSRFFVYEKEGELFYYSIDQYEKDRVVDEGLRRLGPGTLASTSWGRGSELYYIDGTLVYRILGVELFTRTLYRDFLRIGTVVGKIPFAFDPNFDSFWIAPQGDKILLNKGGQNVFLYVLRRDDFAFAESSNALPYLYLPRNTTVNTVAWSREGTITLLTGSLERGDSASSIFRMKIRGSDFSFTERDSSNVTDLVLSPSGEYAAILSPQGVTVRDYESWEIVAEYSHPQPLSAEWLGEGRLLVAGRYIIETIDFGEAGPGEGEPEKELVTLSQAGDKGFAVDDGTVTAVTQGNYYQYTPEAGWTRGDAVDFTDAAVSNESYRVYLETLDSGSYRNVVMVRNIKGVGTTALFDPPERTYEPFPESDDPVNLTNFSHGSRIRRREVSFVFNAIDSVEGLTSILNTLADYNIAATFFVNGDFIRRHPGAVREIAESGHEVGSLFYTYFDMTDSRYQVTDDFIRQGLARNEDEYFNATGKELSLLWHAPYYFVSPEIIRVSQELNYTYVGRDVDSLDWVPRRDDSGVSRLYRPSVELVGRILEKKKPGSIIAMTVGKPGLGRDAERDDYLFQHLDLLINRLIERGYDVVPVSTLIEHAQ